MSDSVKTRYGIREITSELYAPSSPLMKGVDQDRYRLFRVNHQPILIRGAGWAPDLFLRENASRVRSELEYVRHMNLNTVRMEGKMPFKPFFDIA